MSTLPKSQAGNRTDDDARAWHRAHANGQVALVFQWVGGFAAGAIPSNGSASISSKVPGPIQAAQAYADRASGCPQPCNCPPWQE
jgi:hypothetical protein